MKTADRTHFGLTYLLMVLALIACVFPIMFL